VLTTNNLASQIKKVLPPPLTGILKVIEKLALKQGTDLYLVGGVVRDLLLGRPAYDLDLVAEGNAIRLARELTATVPGKVTAHHRFGTAKIKFPGFNLDLTTARIEHYTRPGVLPSVKSGTIQDDLFRRDFTINAMAVRLMPASYGDVLDIYGGLDDLKDKLIRTLHDKSFSDDATRIWRALRYQQRLNFQLEPGTLSQLVANTAILGTVSGERIRYELECVFKEAQPEKVVRQAAELGVLERLHPALSGNGGIDEVFKRARELNAPNLPSFAFYLALLICNLSLPEAEQVVNYLRLPRSTTRMIRDVVRLKNHLPKLREINLKPSRVFELLSDHTPASLSVGALVAPPEARQHIIHYLARYRYARPALNGNDLIALGIKPSPKIKETLTRLRAARLNGQVTSKRQEAELVKHWLKGTTHDTKPRSRPV